MKQNKKVCVCVQREPAQWLKKNKKQTKNVLIHIQGLSETSGLLACFW